MEGRLSVLIVARGDAGRMRFLALLMSTVCVLVGLVVGLEVVSFVRTRFDLWSEGGAIEGLRFLVMPVVVGGRNGVDLRGSIIDVRDGLSVDEVEVGSEEDMEVGGGAVDIVMCDADDVCGSRMLEE